MQSVLISGGTGSLGTALARRLLAIEKPDRIVIFSRGEHAQEAMARTLPDPDGRLRFFIGDVRDKDRLRLAMRGVDTVIHAAALKVVPKCEVDPSEAVKTNIIGADNVIHAAIDAEVGKVVAISTDKAVSPANLYGATKLCAEKMFVAAGAYSGREGTRFAVCRYGNVSGSQGSVIPLWRDMLASGRATVPVTNVRATRYWLTLDEAVALVLWTAEAMQGGEIVVPAMPAYSVGDLAEAMGAGVEIIGMRSGEKLHEAIVSEHEARSFVMIEDKWVANARPESQAPILTHALTSDTARRMDVAELKERLLAFDIRQMTEAAA